MHVIIINGPKFSGKDTLCNLLLKLFPGAIHARFKDVLYEYSHDLWNIKESQGLTLEAWIELCNDPDLKDVPVKWLANEKGKSLSPRQALIHVSEDIIKEEYGPDGVAYLTVMRLQELYPDYKDKLFIFSDGGFNNEIKSLMNDFGIRRKDVTIVRVDRKGCSFAGDSREYIHNPDLMLTNRDNDPSFYLAQAKTDFLYRAMDGLIPISPVTNLKIADVVKDVKPFNVRN